MRRPGWFSPKQKADADGTNPPAAVRERIAQLMALVTMAAMAVVFAAAAGPQFLMPGPLSSAHGSIAACKSCHAASGNGNFSWIKGLVSVEPHGDSKACLSCHQMPEPALNAHGASAEKLKASTERLVKLAANTAPPLAATIQRALFPTQNMAAQGMECAACHQEHQGAGFDITTMSNAQCRSCHVVTFDSFDTDHPAFVGYPFARRTRIKYDHAGHFTKHYPELAKKGQTKAIPGTCSTCHDSEADPRIMAVAPFEKTCGACHSDQITGTERVSGPKGIAFLSLPGLDVATLKKRNADIGEWPEDSDAALTPFMTVMIGSRARGAAVLAALKGLSLHDLSAASDLQIKAAADLVWEIKRLIHELISGRASDLLAEVAIAGEEMIGAQAAADLTANLPRDVIVSAQRQWLPNLAKEMSARQNRRERQRSGFDATGGTARTAVLGFMRLRAGVAAVRPLVLAEGGVSPLPRRDLPSGTPRSIELRESGGGAAAAPARRKNNVPAGLPPSLDAPAVAPSADEDTGAGGADRPGDGGPQTDDLLAPNAAELREIEAREKGAPPPKETAAGLPPVGAGTAEASSRTETPGSSRQTAAASTVEDQNLDEGIDAEDWADTGGWYRQDYAIYYRPSGHKDRFVYSWLMLTGPAAPRGETNPAAAVFDALTAKDAQGACTKCHSVDDTANGGRIVNFSPLTAGQKSGQFTRFVHEPHFGLMGEQGCLACHTLARDDGTLKSYEQGDPSVFASNFGPVKSATCQACHARGLARQDCGLCHTYHITGVVTPMMKTKIPTD
jgi:hypothetical protein